MSKNLEAARPSVLRRPTDRAQASRAVMRTRVAWQTFSTIEERQSVRMKIRKAYVQRCPTYAELLAAAAAVEEELLFVNAPSRLDYFKSGFFFSEQIANKRKEIECAAANVLPGSEDESDEAAVAASAVAPAAKRSKQSHAS